MSNLPRLVSVVIPCYNEDETLPVLVDRLAKLVQESPYAVEVLIVNDGSTDQSPVLLNQLAQTHEWLRVVHFGRNFGHQVAIAAGMDYARGEAVIVMDGDLQDPPELVPDIVERIASGADVVHMQRTQRAGETWLKLKTAEAFYWLFEKMAVCKVVRNCGDFRGVSRRALDVTNSFREPHKFHRAAFAYVGLNQEIMEYDRDPRYAGETKYPLHKLLKLAADGIMSFTAAPLRMVMAGSILMWCIAAGVGLKALYGKFILQQVDPGYTTLVCLQVFLTGAVLFALSIVGDYIRRVFEQGQNRPLYWISETRNLPLQEFGANVEQRLSQRVGIRAGDSGDQTSVNITPREDAAEQDVKAPTYSRSLVSQ